MVPTNLQVLDQNKLDILSAVIYTDGSSLGNPGPAGSGAVIYLNDGYRLELRRSIGIATSNIAEYSALIMALEHLLDSFQHIRNIHIRADSQLMVYHLLGKYKVRSANIYPVYEKTRRLLDKFSWNIGHISRKLNKLADRLAGEASSTQDESLFVELVRG